MSSSTSFLSLENWNIDQAKTGSLKRKRLDSTESDSDLDEESCRMLEYVPKIAETFRIVKKIGEGTFSSVYLAKLKEHPNIDQYFALKHIIPTSHPSRIENELKCLQLIGGIDNVIGVKCCIREKDHVVIIMPYFSHDKFQKYLKSMTIPEICHYMKNLLIGLKRVHQFDIIHRDVKPSNFLYNRKTKSYALVDFGLAHKAPVLLKTEEEPKDEKTSPGKRKTRRSGKNLGPVSPGKHRPSTTSLAEISPNVPDDSKTEIKQEGKNTDNKKPVVENTTNPGFQKTFKSPRRILLQRRMLEKKGLTLTTGGAMKKSMESSLTHRRTLSGGRAHHAPTSCQCYGMPSVCTVCISRSNQTAPRAGTPGYRAPEVLMKCPDQSTAVDMWSAGVIFLSLLTQRYPFFHASDDLTALAQIISVFGSNEVQKSALTYNKKLICSPNLPAANLRKMCEALRKCSKSPKPRAKRSCLDKDQRNDPLHALPDSAYDLLGRLLDTNPHTRITAEEALDHVYFKKS